jgi:hypothetical protein
MKEVVHVLAGHDRFNKNKLMIWGLLPLSIKLSAKDTNGELLVFEHNGIQKEARRVMCITGRTNGFMSLPGSLLSKSATGSSGLDRAKRFSLLEMFLTAGPTSARSQARY